MKYILLIGFSIFSLKAFAQPKVNSTKRKVIYKFYTFEINRLINDGVDTSYFVSFQNREYLHITDMLVHKLSKNELKEMADGFYELSKKEHPTEESTINLSNNYYLRKTKVVFKTFVDLVSPDNKYNGVQVSKIPEMKEAIYNELNQANQ